MKKKNEGSKNNNLLDHSKLYELYKLLDRDREQIAQSRRSLKDIAAVVSKSLGFSVTENNIASAMKIAGIAVRRPGGGAGLMANLTARVQVLEEWREAMEKWRVTVDALFTSKRGEAVEGKNE